MSATEIELYRTHSATQERRAYFLLASAGAAIAFAVTQTQNGAWSIEMWAWAVAVGCWALSFYFGLRHMAYVGSTVYGNMDLLKVESGRHLEVGNHPQIMAAASEGIRRALETNSNRSAQSARLQFAFLVAGGAAFVAWHIYGMVLRAASDEALRDVINSVEPIAS